MSDEENVYPAECHLRIITEADKSPGDEIQRVLQAYEVTAPLDSTNASKGGKYQSLSVSVVLHSREQNAALDGALRAVDGVKIVL